MSVAVKRILLDSLKPRELSLVDLSKALGSVSGVEEVNIIVIEVDSQTETVKVTMKGPNINYNEVREVLGKQGVSIKGVDEISMSRA